MADIGAKTVRKIVDKALQGGVVTREECATLFSVPLLSEESYLIQFAAREISAKASGGLAEVHAQVGLNSGPCPKNCAFCSFAACNGIFTQYKELSLEEVLEKCIEFERQGANAIYLMSTANFPFENFLKKGQEVRRHLLPETILIANTGDLNYHQAAALKEAGFNGVYHAVRLGEGVVTGLEISKRLATVKAVREAGLLLGTCVEPVGPEHSIEELVEKTFLTKEFNPVFSGAARRIPIPGTDLALKGKISEARMALILAGVRLVMGYGVPGNCTHEPNVIGAAAGANLLWAEVGSNPRDINDKTEANRGYDVDKCIEVFREAEWNVLRGPSKIFGR